MTCIPAHLCTCCDSRAEPFCEIVLAGRSMCPQIRGLTAVKMATLLMLIGGLERKDEGGMHIRGEVHMLLVGDPGTGTAVPAN